MDNAVALPANDDASIIVRLIDDSKNQSETAEYEGVYVDTLD